MSASEVVIVERDSNGKFKNNELYAYARFNKEVEFAVLRAVQETSVWDRIFNPWKVCSRASCHLQRTFDQRLKRNLNKDSPTKKIVRK